MTIFENLEAFSIVDVENQALDPSRGLLRRHLPLFVHQTEAWSWHSTPIVTCLDYTALLL